MPPYDTTFQVFSSEETASLRKGGRILRECLQYCASLVEPGVMTADIDRRAEHFIRDHGALPAFQGYRGYPATLCISVNDEVVHGIPAKRVLQKGDVVSLDGGVLLEGLYTDACVTVVAGEASGEVQRFLEVTSQTLSDVVRTVVKAGAKVGDISAFIQGRLEESGYSPIRALTGHGLGTTLHQFPDIPNWGEEGAGPLLPAGTMLAVEPIATIGSSEVITDDDGWTIRTKDGSLACHFEHSVLVVQDGCEIIA